MNKTNMGIIILSLILLITQFQGCITDGPASKFVYQKDTFYVDIKGSTNFSSIQEAINAAPENYTIFILNGHYIENLIINKPLILMGENPDTTIIDGNRTGDTILVDSDNVVISNCSIMNSGRETNDASIHIISRYATIKHNIISNSKCGIYLRREDAEIHNNTIKLCTEYGVYVHSSSNTKLIDNEFFLNDCSLRIKGSQHCEIIRNRFNNSNKGMYFCCGAKSNIVYHNTFINHSSCNADDQVGSNGWNNIDLSEGNFWDDYNGVDENNDGIGDSAYNVTNTGRKDFFPLMNPI